MCRVGLLFGIYTYVFIIYQYEGKVVYWAAHWHTEHCGQ